MDDDWFAGAGLDHEAAQQRFQGLKVKDVMTAPVQVITPEAEIPVAMAKMVQSGISGMPVVDDHMRVVGTVSGFDLLGLERTVGTVQNPDGYFPPVNRCVEEYGGDRQAMWTAFKQLRRKIDKAKGTKVGDVMHDANTINQNDSLEEATSLVVLRKLHRMSVVDDEGKIAGILSRGDIIRVYLQGYQAFLATEERH